MVYLAFVCSVWLGIALFVDLFQGNLRRGVELELEDVDVAGTFEHTVYATLARLLLHVGVVLAKELHDEVERVLEVTLTLLLVLLALEAVGYVGEHGGELEAEGVELSLMLLNTVVSINLKYYKLVKSTKHKLTLFVSALLALYLKKHYYKNFIII